MRRLTIAFLVLAAANGCSSGDSSSAAAYDRGSGGSASNGAISTGSTSATTTGGYVTSGGGGTYGSTGAGGSLGGPAAGGGGGSPPSSAEDAGSASPDGGAQPDGSTDGELGDADRCAVLDKTKPLTLYQSADDSNSMASPAIARRLIRLGQRVPAWIVRTYEFLNYYRFAYEPAPAGRVRVVPQMTPGKVEGEYILQVGIQSAKAASPRRPMSITLVLDTSGSMQGEPIRIEIASVKALAAAMQEGDRVSMVTWNTQNRVLLEGYVVQGPNDPRLLAAADTLTAGGGTDLSGGLAAGYQLANRYYAKELLNRVVLISDGQANVGQTDENIIGQASHNQDSEGIYLVGVSVGDGINDTLMNVVTDRGRGAYVYLDSPAEASRMLTGRFDETMEVAARGVRLELTVPWYFSMKTFSGEQSSTNPNAVDPQHLAPDDAMVFHEIFGACAVSALDTADSIGVKATYETPITHEAREDGTTVTIADLLEGPAAELRKGKAVVAYAEALRGAATLDGAAARAKIDAALAEVQAVNSSTDPELVEIADLLRQYRTQFP